MVPRRRSQLLLRWRRLVELLLLLLRRRRRLVLDPEPGLIEDQVLNVALDGHTVSIRAQLPPQLLFNKQLDDFLLLLLLVEIRSFSVRLRLTASIRARATIVVDVVVDLLFLMMDNRNMTVARRSAQETLTTFFTCEAQTVNFALVIRQSFLCDERHFTI